VDNIFPGHCGVGSIVNLNNAKVASILGADMVLIANGGLGSAIDELELNRVLCQHYGVRLAGVVINKVFPDKYDQTKTYMTKALKQMWGGKSLTFYYIFIDSFSTFHALFSSI